MLTNVPKVHIFKSEVLKKPVFSPSTRMATIITAEKDISMTRFAEIVMRAHISPHDYYNSYFLTTFKQMAAEL